MQTKHIDLLRTTYLERKRILDEYKAKKKLYAEKEKLYATLRYNPKIQRFENIRFHVDSETSLLGFIIKENGTYDRILSAPSVKKICDLENEIRSLSWEINELSMQLAANRDLSLFGVNIPTMKIDDCQHELCTMNGILSKEPASPSVIRKKALNYETKKEEVLTDVGFMPGDFFAYHCLDCDLENPIAVPKEYVPEFESTHKIIYGFRHTPHYLQVRYYELLINHSFDEAYQILKEEIENGTDYEQLKQTIEIRKREK